MQVLHITPIAGPLDATLRVPGSKSITNRALVVAALADGATTLDGALDCDDSRRMIGALQRLGFEVDVKQANGLENPGAHEVAVVGRGGHIPSRGATLHVGNAGTAARFLTAFATLGHGRYLVDGVDRMRQRPVRHLVDALNGLGGDVSCCDDSFPVVVNGRGLTGGTTSVAGTASSQFLSAVLLVAPYAAQPVEIAVTTAMTSRPYVDMTVAMMNDFGVRVERDGCATFRVSPARYEARARYLVAGDASSASYLFAAAAIVGGSVRVEGLTRRCGQGDIGFLDVLASMGCEARETSGGLECIGGKTLAGVDVDLTDMPDVAPTLAVVAPFAASPTTIRGIASARRKECDRVAAVCAELSRLGVEVAEYDDGMTIQPCGSWRPSLVRTYGDHRMAMAFALIGLRLPGVAIENPGCVSKTFPAYFEVLAQLSSPEVQ